MSERELARRIETAIRIVPDFPIEGLPFRDVTPLLEDADLFRDIVDAFAERFTSNRPDCVVCIESFGYLFGAPLAYVLGSRVVLARRAGKLPRDTHKEDYDMIYANDRSLEVHVDALQSGERALIVDDVLASGASALAAIRLVERAHAECIGVACVVDFDLGGPRREIEAAGIPITSLATLVP